MTATSGDFRPAGRFGGQGSAPHQFQETLRGIAVDGEDRIFGDDGDDFIVNPSEFGEIFAGLGNDYIFDGEQLGHIRGGAGNDWMENLGGGEDLFQGDNGAAPELGEPPIKGHDVFVNRGGNADGDMENGDDIVVDGPGIERVEGQLGFDWVSFQNDPFGVQVDLDLTIFDPPTLPPSNATVLNRYDRVEGISGSPSGDILNGTANPAGASNGNELVNFDLVTGLSDLVPASERRDLPPDPVTGEAQFGWSGGEIMLGGAGSDILVGEGGDDIIDGDAALEVMILTPDPAIRTGPEWVAYRAAKSLATSTASQAEKDAAAAVAFVDAGAAAQLALEAATAAAEAAMAAADAAEATLTNDITVTDELGNFISGGRLSGDRLAQRQVWQEFMNRCSALLLDLDLELQVATADIAAEAVAVQAQAVADQIASSQTALTETANTSALARDAAQAELVIAENALPADVMVLVPSMKDLFEAMFGGFINPGELSISRVIADNDVSNLDTDTAVYSGAMANYTISVDAVPGFIMVRDNRVAGGGGGGAAAASDGRDLVRNIERLQFSDQSLVIGNIAGRPENAGNSVAIGQPTISGVSQVPNTLTASIDGVTDADNVTATNPTGAVTNAVSWTWESELDPLTGIFTPIIRAGGVNGNGDPIEVTGASLQLTAAEAGLRVRVKAVFQDDDLVFETVVSLSQLVAADPLAPPPVATGAILSIQSATFNARQLRLRVDGTVGPIIGTTAALFAPGTADLATGTCTGTFLSNLTFAPDGTFSYDSNSVPLSLPDPGTVCVSSNNGLAIEAPTTPG